MSETFENTSFEDRLRAGETSALVELFEANRGRLRRMVQFRLDSRLAGRVDPEDVIQEAWVDAVQRLRHFDGKMPAFLWLRWVVQQTMVAVHRRHLGAKMRSAHKDVSIFGGPATSTAMAAQLAGQPTSPSEVAMRQERASLLTDALKQLSALDQEVLAMRHFEDLANWEVAELLGISTKAASIRYIRALERLRKSLHNTTGLPRKLDPFGSSSSSTA